MKIGLDIIEIATFVRLFFLYQRTYLEGVDQSTWLQELKSARKLVLFRVDPIDTFFERIYLKTEV